MGDTLGTLIRIDFKLISSIFCFPELYFGKILGGHIFFPRPDGYQHRVSDHYPGIPLVRWPPSQNAAFTLVNSIQTNHTTETEDLGISSS